MLQQGRRYRPAVLSTNKLCGCEHPEGRLFETALFGVTSDCVSAHPKRVVLSCHPSKCSQLTGAMLNYYTAP